MENSNIVEQEVDFEEFVDDFFMRPIGPPNSISQFLSFDCESPQKIYEMLLVIFTQGLKRAYGGNGVRLAEIAPEKIDKLNKRFAMIGVKPVIETCQAPRVYEIDNTQYERVNNLKDMLFTMEQDGILYRIHFEFV